MGRHLPQGQVPLATTAQATTAQVDNCPWETTAPGQQLPLGDNWPGKGEILFMWHMQARQKILGAKC